MTTKTQPSLEQQRAEHALQQIQEIKGKDDGHYVSYVSALPATIVMNGLGQALATLLAKAKGDTNKPHYMLYTHVASWLSQQITELKGDTDGVVKRLMENDQQVYLRAQAEAMAYVHWLKQFARAYLKEKEGQGDE